MSENPRRGDEFEPRVPTSADLANKGTLARQYLADITQDPKRAKRMGKPAKPFRTLRLTESETYTLRMILTLGASPGIDMDDLNSIFEKVENQEYL